MEIEIPEKVEIWERLPDKAKKDLTAKAVLERTTPQKLILSWIYSILNVPEIVMPSNEYEQEAQELED